MADVNNLLPDVGKLDTSSTAYTEKDSLQDIANKYTDLGKTVSNFGIAAANDVHNRQVKLIGNDFGGVDPVSYAAYYQPSINDAQSEMRVKGTEKALTEGMDRGKAAAEANLNAAKNAYSKALDAYNNAKEAFAQAEVAMVPGLETSGTSLTGNEVQSVADIANDPKGSQNKFITNYTDTVAQSRDPEHFWDSKDAWKIAKDNVRKQTGKNISDEEFRSNTTYGQAVTKAYIEEYFSSRGETKNLEKFRSSYDYMYKAIDDVIGYVQGVVENPEFLKNNQLIRENRGEKPEGFSQEASDLLNSDSFKEIFGFDILSMHEAVMWKQNNPEQFDQYNKQLAQATGLSQTLEVADGKRWYLMSDGKYKQLKKGTPVFFAFPGSMNEDGSFNDKKLEKFIKLYRDYYKADMTSISNEELTQRQEALNNAYTDYMKNVAAVLQMETLLDTNVTKDLYNTILACMDDGAIAESTYMINGATAQEWINSFKEAIAKNPDGAAAYFQEIADMAYGNVSSFYRYDPSAKSIVKEAKNYSEDSTAAPGQKKLVSRAFPDQEIRNKVRETKTQQQALAEFLLYTRSMEEYNDNTGTNTNINPNFLENRLKDFSVEMTSGLYNWFISTPASLINLAIGAAGNMIGVFSGGENDVESVVKTDIFNNGYSGENVWGGLFDPNYSPKGHDNGVIGAGIQTGQVDSLAKQYAMSLVNPLFVDIINGDKDWQELIGVAQQYSPEAQGMFDSKTGFDYSIMRMSTIIAAGGAEKMLVKGVTKLAASAMTSKLATKMKLSVMPTAVKWTTNEKIALKYAETGAFADDPLQVAGATAARATRTVNEAKATLNTLAGTARVEGMATDVASAGGRVAKAADKLDDVYGVLTRNAVHGLTSMSANSIDDLIQNFGQLVKEANASNENYRALAAAAPKVVLTSGETVSLADATLVVQANRTLGAATLSMMTGVPVTEFAKLPDNMRQFLMNTANKMTASEATVFNKGLGRFLKSLTPDDFTVLAKETLKRAEINAEIGKSFDKLDIYRIAAKSGWTHSGATALAKEFLKDALTDPFRDFLLNVKSPQLDKEGNYQVESISEYFTNPGNIAFNLAFSTLHFAGSRIKNQGGAALYSRWADKAWNEAQAAIDATGDASHESAQKALNHALNLSAKAQEYADEAWKVGQSYKNVEKYTAKTNQQVDLAIDQIFKANSWDVDYGGKRTSLKTKEDFMNYIKDQKMNPQEGLFVLANSLGLKATSNYYLNKISLGTDVREFGNLPSNTYIKIYKTMSDVAKKNMDKIKNSNGDVLTKTKKMYKLMSDAIVKANNNGEYGLKIRNLETSLNYFFGNLESRAKEGLASGDLPNLRLGYLPLGSFTFEGSYEDMIKSHENAASRGLYYEGGNVDVTANNPAVARDVLDFDTILDAMAKGETELKINRRGEEVTLQLDYDGLNPLDMITVYQNNYNIHKYLDPLVGDSRLKFGDAALQNYNAYVIGNIDTMSAAATKDLYTARAKMMGAYDPETGKMTAGWAQKIRDLAVGSEYEKAAKDLANGQVAYTPVGEKLKAKLDETTNKIQEYRAQYAANKKVIESGDNLVAGYSLLGKLFGYEVNGYGDAAKGKVLWDNATIVGNKLIEAYSNGKLSEANIKDGFEIEVQYNGQKAHKTIKVSADLLAMVKNAYITGGVNSDLIVSTAALMDLATPYYKKTVAPNGTVSYNTFKSYKSVLNEKYNPVQEKAPRSYNIDVNHSFNTAKFADGTKVKGIDVSGLTIQEAYGRYVDSIRKAEAAQKGSQSLTEGVSDSKATTKNNKALLKGAEDFTSKLINTWAEQNGDAWNELKTDASGKSIYINGSKEGMRNALLYKQINGDIDRGQSLKGGNIEMAKEKLGLDKTITIGNVDFNSAELISTTYRLKRSESGDSIEVKSRQSDIDKLTEASENIIFEALGVKKNKDGNMPEAAKLFVQSIVDRAKVELTDAYGSDGFTAFDWFNKLDAIAPDADVAKVVFDKAIVDTTGKNPTKRDIFSAFNSLEEDGALELFQQRLYELRTELQSGVYDIKLPDGVTADDLIDEIQDTLYFMITAKDYNNRPKANESITSTIGDDGEEMDPFEGGKYGSTDINGESDLPVGGRTDFDLSKATTDKRIKNTQKTLERFFNTDDELNKVYRPDTFNELRDGRIKASEGSKKLYKSLVEAGKKLYDSGVSAEYNARVDESVFNINSRSKKAPTAEALNAAYAEALGVVSPDTRANAISGGREYNAAKMAEAEGITDRAASEGWNEKTTKMRVAAETYGGYIKQIGDGYKELSKFAGEEDPNLGEYKTQLNEARVLYNQLNSVLKTPRGGANDTYLSSITAMLGDVYDPQSMVKQMNGSEMKNFLTESKRALESSVYNAIHMTRPDKYGYYDGEYAPHRIGRVDLETFKEENKLFFPAKKLYDEIKNAERGVNLDDIKYEYQQRLAKMYDSFKAENNNDPRIPSFRSFIANFEAQCDAFDEHYNTYMEYQNEYSSITNHAPTPSQEQGKASMFTDQALNLIGGIRDTERTAVNDLPYVEGKGNVPGFSIQSDFGTGNLDSNSGFGLTFITDDGDYYTPAEFDKAYGIDDDLKDRINAATGATRAKFINPSELTIDFTEKALQERAKATGKSIEEVREEYANRPRYIGNKQMTADEIKARVNELETEYKTVLEQEKAARELGDLKENEDYQAARKRRKEITEELGELRDVHATAENTAYTGILQEVNDNLVLAGVADNGFNDFERANLSGNRSTYGEETIYDDVMSKFAEATADYNPAFEVSKAKENLKSLEKKGKALTEEADKLKSEVDKETVGMDTIAKKVLSKEDYKQYVADKNEFLNIKESIPKENGDFYRSDYGKYSIVNDSKIPEGHVTLASLLTALGYDREKFNSDISSNRKYTVEEIKADYKARKKMQKEITKQQTKGNVVFKNVEGFMLPSELDLRSKTMTINNLLSFGKQIGDKTGIYDPSKMVVSKAYADLLYRCAREGIGGEHFMQKVKGVAFEITDWNKFIQDFQLAGGASFVNALTIAQVRGAIFSSPTRMAQYIKLASDFKDDAAVAKFAVENSERLVQIAMKTGDTTVFTDFQKSASSRPGWSDGGTVSALVDKLSRFKEDSSRSESKYEFAKGYIDNAKDALFGDATFQRTLPVLRAKMLIMNYDQAQRLIVKKFPNIAKDDLEDAACKFAYVKTAAFFEPNKTQSGFFKSRNINEVLSKIQTQKQRDLLNGWVGGKADITLGQMATNCFFALGYKNRMVQSILQGARSIISPSEWGMRKNVKGKGIDLGNDIKLSNNSLLGDLGTQFMQSGNRQQIRSLAFLAATAFISAKAMGLATAWDDLNFVDEEQVDENGNPQFKVPDILTKFQTIGQIWIPNAVDKDGKPIIDPTKTAYKIDTMSSLFTLPNTAWKTIDRITDPEAYYSAPQRGLPFLGVNNPINQFINSDIPRALGDELIGSNLLSPYKAMYEVLVDSSYYGNNIWEKKYLKDGSINKNYDPMRNVTASFFHILGLDEALSPRGYNDYVKGYYTDGYVAQDQMGSIAGAGILQHEYITGIKQFFNDKGIDGIIEAGELPIKKQTLSSTARTEFNTKIKNVIAQYMREYRNKTDGVTSIDVKDKAYAEAVKKSADAVTAWSNKYNYVLGKDQSLVPYVTRTMMCILSGEYDDNLDYVQNAYWKASAIAQIEATGSNNYWLDDEDVDLWIANGKTAEEFAEEKNRRYDAYNKAMDDEYKARKALHDAGIDNEYLAGLTDQNIKAERRAINRAAYEGAMNAMNSPVGEFKNFKEMKTYYEAQINAASSTKQKAKLADQYNTYVTDALAPYVDKYGNGIIADGYYNNEYLSNALADYIIIPADKYYSGKSPRANYLKDLFGVGYRDKSNLPSDKEVIAGYEQARKEMQKGYVASSIATLDGVIDAIKRGRLYVSDGDYSRIVKMKAYLSSKSN